MERKSCFNGDKCLPAAKRGDWVRRFINPANILFLCIVILEFLPGRRPDGNMAYVLVFTFVVEAVYLLTAFVLKDKEKVTAAGDVTAIIFGLVFLWELVTAKLDLLEKVLYPSPGQVFALFVSELPEMIKGMLSSLRILISGYVLALVIAVPTALVAGWRIRLYRAVKPLTKILGPIPPIVYIPYAIAILPTFRAASIFIIFIGSFWPIFINTLNGVFNIDKKIIDSAKVLNVKERAMLFEVILPGTIPSILSGATIGLVLSFVLLTAAEMIGATSGLGWYVKYFSDFADYPRVIVGIIFIGIVVTAITFIMDKLEQHLLRWKK